MVHGASYLPSVKVDSYNAELRDGGGFVGDRASYRGFRAILDDHRERAKNGRQRDPLGEKPSEEIGKKKLDKALLEGDSQAAGIVESVIEDFAQEFATVIRRFLRLKSWHGTRRIVIGGGLRNSRVGEIAIGRTAVILQGEARNLDLIPVHSHPDEAGLIGTLHLAPSWIFQGHDCTLAVDIGGSNIRVGLVEIRSQDAADLSKAKISAFQYGAISMMDLNVMKRLKEPLICYAK
jgi:predicted NBD/HSP70 family sugar kinase